MSDKKRKPKKFLTLAEKKQVIEEAEKGYSGRKIALKFEVDRTVVAKILREKERILIEYGQNTNPNRKRNFLSTKHNELNEKVYELFKTCMERNIPVTGELRICLNQSK